MFYVSDLLGGAKDLLVGNFIKNQFLDARDWPFGAAASVAMMILMGLMMAAYFASIRKIGKERIG
jgi:spermidine/putrescine transport system permease protein